MKRDMSRNLKGKPRKPKNYKKGGAVYAKVRGKGAATRGCKMSPNTQ